MTTTPTTSSPTGVVVSTPIIAEGWSLNHAEGVVSR